VPCNPPMLHQYCHKPHNHQLVNSLWAGLAKLLRMGLAGIGAITIDVAVLFFSQARQAYFGRRVLITLRLAGMYSSCSLFSSPILCRSSLQQGQFF
jgi:hypothetical protein